MSDDLPPRWEWTTGAVAVESGQSETLWIGSNPVADVWEIQIGAIWTIRGDRSGYVPKTEGTFDDAKSEVITCLRRVDV